MVLCLLLYRIQYPVIDQKQKVKNGFVLNFNDQAIVDNVKKLRVEMLDLNEIR